MSKHTQRSRRAVTWLFALWVSAALGCGTSPPGKPASEGDNEEALKQLAETYRYLAHEKRRPPAKATDLEEFEGNLPIALPKVKSGEIVVVWGAGYSSSSSAVLAHEKDAAVSGGQVLLRNGTVKKMTAAEFAAANPGR